MLSLSFQPILLRHPVGTPRLESVNGLPEGKSRIAGATSQCRALPAVKRACALGRSWWVRMGSRRRHRRAIWLISAESAVLRGSRSRVQISPLRPNQNLRPGLSPFPYRGRFVEIVPSVLSLEPESAAQIERINRTATRNAALRSAL